MIDRRLHVLRAVASQGTVTAAARSLNYMPSAVSHQLRGLSEHLGVSLVEPDGRAVRLTAGSSSVVIDPGHVGSLRFLDYARKDWVGY